MTFNLLIREYTDEFQTIIKMENRYFLFLSGVLIFLNSSFSNVINASFGLYKLASVLSEECVT